MKIDTILSRSYNSIKNLDLLNLVQESTKWHYSNCAIYRLFSKKKLFSPIKDLKSVKDFNSIPYLTTASFKKYSRYAKKLLSIPNKDINIWSFSRGTSFDSSMIGRDEINIKRLERSLTFAMFDVLKIPEPKWFLYFFPPFPQEIFSEPYPYKVPHFNFYFEDWFKKNISNFDEIRTYGIKIVDPLARYEIKKYGVAEKEVIDLFKTSSLRDEPGIIFGYVPGIWLALQRLKKETLNTQIHPNSMVITFGGWFSPDKQKIPQEIFRQKISKILNLSDDRIRDLYSFTETDIVFAECEYHHKHIPPWADVIVRDVENLTPVEYGKKGLINIINPLAYSYVGISILQDDVVVKIKNDGVCSEKGDIIKVSGPAF